MIDIKDKMKMIKLLNKNTILSAIRIMENHPRYSEAEKSIRLIFETYPNNRDLSAVIAKVCLLNDLYGTSIYNTFRMAEYIQSINDLDHLLKNGDLTAIELIRKGHGIKANEEKDWNFYSFATKYCSFHNPEKYPIWDNLVSDLIYRWNKELKWFPGLIHADLHDYPKYVKIIELILQKIDENLSVKTLDMGLWIIGKYIFRDRVNVFDEYVVEEFGKVVNK